MSPMHLSRPIPRLLVRAGCASALLVTLLSVGGGSHSALAQQRPCETLLDECHSLLEYWNAQDSATISNLRQQLSAKPSCGGGLTDARALGAVSSALDQFEKSPQAKASTKELMDRAEQLKNIQQRVNKLSEKLTVQAAAAQKAASQKSH
jgi:hypothetical protein